MPTMPTVARARARTRARRPAVVRDARGRGGRVGVRARPRRRKPRAHSSPKPPGCPWTGKHGTRRALCAQDPELAAIRTQTWGPLPGCPGCHSNAPGRRPTAGPLPEWLGTELCPIRVAPRRLGRRAWTRSNVDAALGPSKARPFPLRGGATERADSRCVVLCVAPLLHKFGKGAVSFPHGGHMDVGLDGCRVSPIFTWIAVKFKNQLKGDTALKSYLLKYK